MRHLPLSYTILLSISHPLYFFFFFFNDTATTEIYTLSLHDALPISFYKHAVALLGGSRLPSVLLLAAVVISRSEEHTSELQSQSNLVCRLLLEKKKKIRTKYCS